MLKCPLCEKEIRDPRTLDKLVVCADCYHYMLEELRYGVKEVLKDVARKHEIPVREVWECFMEIDSLEQLDWR